MNQATANTMSVSVDPMAREVQVNGTIIELGRSEYRLIEELAIAPLTGVSYRQIAVSLSSIRGPVTTSQVKATASSLRRKLRAAGINRPIPEIQGVGLRLQA